MKNWNTETVVEAVAILGGIAIGLYACNTSKKNDSQIQQPAQNEYKYDINEYRKRQEEIKKPQKECLRIVSDYLKSYGYNVTYIYTTDPSLNNWKYNVKGTITNADGTTRHFGVLYDYPTKTIRTFDVD